MLHFLSAVSKTEKVIFCFDRRPSNGLNPHHDFFFLQLVDSSERPLAFPESERKSKQQQIRTKHHLI
jgi:hypothetical protein